MKAPKQAFLDILLEIYAAAVKPSHWDLVLKKIAEEVEATKASMHVHQFSRQRWEAHTAGSRLHSYGYDAPSAESYARHFAVNDPYVSSIRKHFRRGRSVGTSDDLITAAELKSTEFFDEYGRKNGIFFVGWAVIEQNERFGSGLAVVRPEDADQFGPEQVLLLESLKPHLENSFHIQRTLDSASSITEALLQSVAQLGIAVVALDDGLRIINLSAPAKAYVDEKDAIRVRDRRLEATGLDDDQALKSALKAAAKPWENPLGILSRALLLRRRSGRKPLQVVVSPFTARFASLSASGVPFGEDQPRVLVFLSDPSSGPLSRGAILRLLYGLTKAEAGFADLLLQGYSLKDAALLSGIKAGTARDRLKQIFAKTGTRRQSELMKLMLSLPALPMH